MIREKGTNRSAFFRGEVDAYTWIDAGSSYLLSEIQSAFLFGQLEARGTIQGRRKRIWSAYADRLATWAETSGVPCLRSRKETGSPSTSFICGCPGSANAIG